MIISEVSKRYAKALYELAKESGKHEKILVELRAISETLNSEAMISEFICSPLVSPESKAAAVNKSVAGKVSPEVINLMVLLADKNRLAIFSDLVVAYEQISDADHGVTRGTVRSASVVSAEARKSVELTVTRATGKKVILNYIEDASLLGGLVAQVGGWTFDDSLSSHLTKIGEELNRRAN